MPRADPLIFVPDETGNPLQDVLIEQYDHFDIYWYHWPKDGEDWYYFIFREEGYEPVIVVYCDKKIKCIVTRPHWDYQYTDVEDSELTIPCQILFEDQWHPPLTRTRRNEREFELKKSKLTQRHYTPKSITKDVIFMKFRTGKGHRGNFGKAMMDPVSIAQQAYEYYCNK